MSIEKNKWMSLRLKIRNELLGKILSGDFREGDRLPSEAEFQKQFGVSRTTVRQALAELANAGFIYSKPGKGTYVASSVIDQSSRQLLGFSDHMYREGKQVHNETFVQRVIGAPKMVASRLQVFPGTDIFQLQRLRYADEFPVAIDDTRLVYSLCPEIVGYDFNKISLYGALREIDKAPVRCEQTISARMANESEQATLQLSEEAPVVVVVERIAYLRDSQPLEYSLSIYRGDRYKFNVILGEGADVLSL